MPVYVEMVVNKKTGKKVEKKVNDKKQYYIRTYITDENGKRKQVTKHNKNWLGKEGQIEASREENRLKRKFTCLKLPFSDLINLFYEEYKKNVKESTFVSYKENINNHILPFFKNLDINYENTLLWHKNMETKNFSIAYLNKINTVLCLIFDVAIKYKVIERNFVKDIGCFKPHKVDQQIEMENVRYITYTEFCKFISVIDNQLWYTVFNLLYYTGMRKGELIALTWNDIDFLRKKITINKTYTDRAENLSYNITTTKNCKNRVIDIDNTTLDVLKDWFKYQNKNEQVKGNEFVFGRTHPISTTTMTNRKNKYFKRAGFEHAITIHEFRHSHVSLLVNEYLKSNNNDMTKFFIMMSNRMGHTIQVMQKTYMHLFPETQKPITDLLNNLEKQDQKQDQKK